MPRYRFLFWMVAVLLLWWGAQTAVSRLPAAEEVKPAASDKAEAPPNLKKPAPTLGQIIFGSDWIGLSFYAALAIFSIVATTVAIERFVNLRRSNVIPPAFLKRLREMLLKRDDAPESYRLLCEAHPSPIARVLRSGVLRAGRPLPEIEEAMEDAAGRELAALRARNKVLSVAGNVAPLVGLFGTVVGMIISFRVASEADTGKLGQLAEGIYVALLTTAGGLTIAIPSMLCVSWFNARVDQFMREVVDTLADTLPSFNRMHETEERKRERHESHRRSEVLSS